MYHCHLWWSKDTTIFGWLAPNMWAAHLDLSLSSQLLCLYTYECIHPLLIFSILLGRHFTRFWSIAMGIFVYLVVRTRFVSSDTAFRWEGLRSVQSMFHVVPKVFIGVDVKAQCRPLNFLHTILGEAWLLVLTWQRPGHCRTGTGLGPFVLGKWNFLTCVL